MPRSSSLRIAFSLFVALRLFFVSAPSRAAEPSRAGLQLWLDAGDAATIEKDPAGRILKWRDKSGHGHDAVNAGAASNPRLAPAAMGGKPAVHFGGQADSFEIPGVIRARPGSVTVFVVWQRTAAQASGRQWQRLVASSDGTNTPDNKIPNFCMTADVDGDGKAYPPTVDVQEFTGVALGTLRIGQATGSYRGNFLAGDIAEILVYDRSFLSEGDLRTVLDGLHDKWGARIGREDRGWTRTGLLENPPPRTSDAWPLSDQQNKTGWIKNEALSDEFDGAALDQKKWQPYLEFWKGREPARFNPDNIAVSGGRLHLVMRRQQIPPALRANGYTSYTSAAMKSRVKAGYGYYEVKARPMNSAGSSSFWFTNTGLARQGTEIDVFEIGGKAAGFERKYNMNLHVFETPAEKRHWSIGGVWIAPWDLAADFHVYGLDWGKDEIRYYVDGVLVRRAKNTNWLYPMDMVFDSETMPTWFGMPKDEDLPSTFSVEYVRSWKRAGE